MNNEKKAPPQSNDDSRKNRHQKHKGYFITPSQDRNDNKAQQPKRNEPQNAQKDNRNQSPAELKPQERRTSAVQNEKTGIQTGGHAKNRKRKKRPHNPEQNTQTPPAESPKTPLNEQTLKNRNQKNQADHAQPQKHNEKKHKSAQRPQSKNSAMLVGSLEDIPQKKAPSIQQEPVEILDPADIPKDILESPASVNIPSDNDEKNRVEVVGIRFKSSGKIYYFDPQGKRYSRSSHAIVETARGLEYGDVAMGNTFVKEEDVVPPLRPVIRAATPADEEHHKENKAKEDEAFKICNERIMEHKLDMKLIDAQYTFDNSKLLFYFTSAGRVDFRELVKDLASVFRTRIELRQIGIRDEAKLMGGLGLCGRPLCCSLFLSDFGQVSIKMAKEQNLSLNSAKISGICGRLMCCLRYEHETYEYEIKRTPPVDSLVETPDGNGVVTEMNPLAATVKVRLSATPEVPPKTYKRDDVRLIQKKAPQNNENK